MNDIRRLKEETDIAAVIDRLGLDVWHRGVSTFITCPLPTHDDKHATNCYCKEGWSKVFCAACGKAIGPIDLIMYTTGCDFGTAADLLWEINGYPSWYYDDANPKKKKNTTFDITAGEMRFLGLHLSRVSQPVRESFGKEFLNNELPHGFSYTTGPNGEYLLTRSVNNSGWQNFYTPKQMKALVLRKCADKENKLRKVVSVLPGLEETGFIRDQYSLIASLRERTKRRERRTTA